MINKLNLTQKLSVLSKLREVTRQVPDRPGKIVFNPGWNDQIVASSCGVTSQSVKYIRQSELGMLAELPATRIKAERAESEPDIEALIRGAVEKIVAPLLHRVNKLETDSAKHSEWLTGLSANREEIVRRINGLSSEMGVAVAEINKRLGDRVENLNQAIAELDKTTKLRVPNPTVEAIKHAQPKGTLGDKLREAAAKITDEA